MPNRHDDIEAMIAELEAHLSDAPPEMRALLEQQIEASRWAQEQLRALGEVQAAQAALRSPLRPEDQAFFTPAEVQSVGEWISDDLTRAQVDDALLRCPDRSRVYTSDSSVDCRIPAGAGSIPAPHGVSLGFYASGRLSSQSYYERGLLRWAIEYHPSGGRASVGIYSDVEPRSHLDQGLHTGYAPNGTIISQATWDNGVRDGWTRLWEDDGYPIGATRYERGQPAEERLPSAPLPVAGQDEAS